MECTRLPPDLDFERNVEEAAKWLKAVPSQKAGFSFDEILECLSVRNAWNKSAVPSVLKGPYKDGSWMARYASADDAHLAMVFMRVPDPAASSLQPPVKRKLTLYRVSVEPEPDSRRAAFPSNSEDLEQPEANEEASQSSQSEASVLSVSGASLDSDSGEAGEENWAVLLRDEAIKAADANPHAAPRPEFNIWVVSHVPPLSLREFRTSSISSKESQHVPLCERAVAAVKRISLVTSTEAKDVRFKQRLWKTLGLDAIRDAPTGDIADIADIVVNLAKDTTAELLLCKRNWSQRPALDMMMHQYWLHEVDARIEHPLAIPSYFKVADAGTLVKVTQLAPGAPKQLRGAVAASEEGQQAYPAGLLEYTTKKGDEESSGIDFKVYQMMQNLFAHRAWFIEKGIRIKGTVIFNGDKEPSQDFGSSFGEQLQMRRRTNPFLDRAAEWFLSSAGVIHFRWHKKKLSAAESHRVIQNQAEGLIRLREEKETEIQQIKKEKETENEQIKKEKETEIEQIKKDQEEKKEKLRARLLASGMAEGQIIDLLADM